MHFIIKTSLNWLCNELSSDVSILQMEEEQRTAAVNKEVAALLRKEKNIVRQLRSSVRKFIIKMS